MNSETLYQFLEVAQEGSISAASRKLMIAQPALSKRMQALERELGCTLFIRGSRRVSLTEAGEALRERAGQMRLLEMSIRSQMREYSEGDSQLMRLGITPYNSSVLLRPVMERLGKKYPNIHLDIMEFPTQEVLDMVKAGIVEAGIVKTRFSGGPDIEVHCRIKDPLMAVWHPDFPFKPKGKKVSLRELEGMPLSIIRSFYDLLKGYCAQEEFTPNIVCVSTSVSTNLMLVSLKKAVGIAPVSALKGYPELRRVCFNEWYMDSPATLVTLKGRLSMPVRSLIEIYKELADNNNGEFA